MVRTSAHKTSSHLNCARFGRIFRANNKTNPTVTPPTGSMISRCLMEDLRVFRLAVVLQMCGGVLKRCHLRLFLVVVVRLRLIFWSLFFLCAFVSKGDSCS